MKRRFKHVLMALAASAYLFSFSSCSKDDDNVTPEEENENEVITKVELHFKDTEGGEESVFTWSDPDGEGGANPVIQDVVLDAGKTYAVNIKLLDEVNDEDVTEEIEEEALDHRFYYMPSEGSEIIVSDLDKDPQGVTLGLNGKWTAGSAADGSIHIVLRHYAEGGKKESDTVTDSKSSTDADITFKTKVQ